MRHGIKGLLFDKDGTLFDFEASWAPVMAELIAELAGSDAARHERLSEALGFDAAARRFRPSSAVIAGTSADVVALIAPHLPGMPRPALEGLLNARAGAARLCPVTPLSPFAARLREAGFAIGVATNDSEAAAHAHLASAGAAGAFPFVAGYDSGHGAKPGPGMVFAFARAAGLSPADVALVGDSLHDLAAARSAGARGIAVLTGVATAAELGPHADEVLASICDLPAWLGIAA